MRSTVVVAARCCCPARVSRAPVRKPCSTSDSCCSRRQEPSPRFHRLRSRDATVPTLDRARPRRAARVVAAGATQKVAPVNETGSVSETVHVRVVRRAAVRHHERVGQLGCPQYRIRRSVLLIERSEFLLTVLCRPRCCCRRPDRLSSRSRWPSRLRACSRARRHRVVTVTVALEPLAIVPASSEARVPRAAACEGVTVPREKPAGHVSEARPPARPTEASGW